jgi:hypothetical protein
MAQLPKERTRLRAVDPHYCKHPKLIPIWKYKRFPGKIFCKCLVCGREMIRTGFVSSTTVTDTPRTTRQESNSRPL